jgi:hypothetical protein
LNKLNKISFSINYITNFKPHFNTENNLHTFNLSFKKKLISKNFFLFITSMKFFKQTSIFKKSNLFIKKSKKIVYTLLRAPYRHKLTRHQLTLIRYYICQKLDYNLNFNIEINNKKDLNILIKCIKRFYSWFESNIVYQHKIFFSFYFFFCRNFLLLNF